jgi:FKBP-type peptidyl-prolyl cis-trans isomerase FkpA/FKBP-type peptidyl-prolyl cis-trans isomerase FklB
MSRASSAGRLVLTLSLLVSGASLATAQSTTSPAAAPKKGAAARAAASAAAEEKAQLSHDIGLSLATPLRSKLTRDQIVWPQLTKGLQEALAGKTVTDPQREAVQAFVRGAADQRPAASYYMGLEMGEPLREWFLSPATLSLPDIIKGLGDALDGGDSTPETQQRVRAYLEHSKEALGQKNHVKAQVYLADNASKTGVVTTPSGLQYKILAPGEGTSPKPTDTVTVRYTGKLLDGTEFGGTDLSNNEPAPFAVNGVIKGWQEALVLMKPGAKWQLFIPPALAYDMDSEYPIPPGSLLLFTVELLKVSGK